MAIQATQYDILDFIQRLGGWYAKADVQAVRPTDQDHYWEQVIYKTMAPATNSNVTTITMTRSYNQENHSNGNVCPTNMPVTQTVTLDLRELAPTAEIIKSDEKITIGLTSFGTKPIWSVNLVATSTQALIRNVETTTVPTGTPPSTCAPVALKWDAYTTQLDVGTYSIQFADENQAIYLQMLIESAVPTFNPPRLNGMPPWLSVAPGPHP